jgi:EPS-associated MarR family transcriptional regulator
MLTDEMRYRLMKVLEANPDMSQRAIARELGVSLGRVNYCLQALMQKGLIKAKNLRNSDHKLAYMYLLTARGAQKKADLAVRFLRAKMQEYESLEIEIAQIKRELQERNGC